MVGLMIFDFDRMWESKGIRLVDIDYEYFVSKYRYTTFLKIHYGVGGVY